MKRLAVVLILLLAFCGIADSTYIAKNESAGTPLICNFSSLSGCNIVAQSPYNELFGLPIADYGVAFYALLFTLAAVEILMPYVHVRRAIQGLTSLGLIASAYFVFIQLSVINAVCIYCFTSAGIELLTFLLAYFIEPLTKPNREDHHEVQTPMPRTSLTLPPS